MNAAYKHRPHHTILLDKQNSKKETILMRAILQKNKEFFKSGKTKEVEYRTDQLKKLRSAIKRYEDDILLALKNDLNKPAFEAYIAEIAILYQEIDHTLSHIKKWAKTKRVGTPFVFLPAKSWITPEPLGMVLIIGPWNYPFQLTIAPLIGAIAAGNSAILKPSELAPHTSALIAKIIGEIFDKSYIAVLEGGVETTQELLNEKFDHIFFTGGTEVGKIIMQGAAQHLTPVTLELGGKSPAIVNNDASLDVAARKIVWGKYINAGQTCLAPDYLLVHQDVKDELLKKIKFYIHDFYGDNPELSASYARIINQKHFQRLSRFLTNNTAIIGGRTNESTLYIEPTVLDEVFLNQQVMKEEIFGPILPVISFKNLQDAISIVNSMPKPLALYIFSNKKKTINNVLQNTSSGGVSINDVMLHVGNYYLPFGGVGNSGMGAYHGKASFDTFSHKKSIIKKSKFIDVPFRYPPYKRSVNILRRIFS